MLEGYAEHEDPARQEASPTSQGAMAKGRASRKEPDAWDTACQITNTVLEVAKPIVHYTFIPLIIVLGMTMTEPRPSLAQLLGPM
ncbi:g1159 [Coccomyxa viridis]|uniref:G1159 protein n=1 Tax=Coccomyxa viridis TaxID=1274662 RepID=A0ABP1FJG4_9CHLO